MVAVRKACSCSPDHELVLYFLATSKACSAADRLAASFFATLAKASAWSASASVAVIAASRFLPSARAASLVDLVSLSVWPVSPQMSSV